LYAQINTEILDISARNNYWKPYQCFFRYFQLSQYEKNALKLNEPFLELGGGDGIFTNMMLELGVVGGNIISTDINLSHLKKAKELRNDTYLKLDITALPFKDESVQTIYSNGVLCCLNSKLDSDVELVIQESCRVLKEGGIFIASVATNYFNENLSVYRLLKKLNLKSFADRYIKKFEERLSHHSIFNEEKWIELFEHAGLTVKNIGHFFSPRQGYWYGILTLKIFNLFSVIKLIKLNLIKNLSTNILKFLFKKIYTPQLNNDAGENRSGYIVIFSQKEKQFNIST
jgi:SAM-dependent methyltransferase